LRRCSDNDLPAIEAVINEAAAKYKGVIPADCWHEPYMSHSELLAEISRGVAFWVWAADGTPVGVMGVQNVADVTLIRHAYVRQEHQGRGIGSALLKHLARRAKQPLLIGTWAAASWAIRFYQRHGFRLADPVEADRLLRKYWNISARQRETSVVLTLPSRIPPIRP